MWSRAVGRVRILLKGDILNLQNLVCLCKLNKKSHLISVKFHLPEETGHNVFGPSH